MKKPRKDKHKLRKKIAAAVFVATLYAMLMVADANMQTISFATCVVLMLALMPILFISAFVAGAIKW